MNACLRLGALAPLLGSVACGIGFADVDRNVDENPVRDVGVRATVIMPGQGPPPMYVHPAGRPGQPGHPGAGQPGYPAAGQPGAPPAGGGFSSLGGTEIQRTQRRTVRAEPPFWKYVTAPFAVLLYPFKKAGEAIAGDPLEPDPQAEAAARAQRRQAPPPTREEVHRAQEAARLAELERQLGAVSAPPPRHAPRAAAQPSYVRDSTGGALSIADELAALQRRRTPAPVPGPVSSVAPRTRPAPPPAHVTRPAQDRVPADRVEDRDGDGRPDYWAYRRGDRMLREVFDANGDGAPDRTLFYGGDGHLARAEEDADADGRADTWTEYRAGQLARRRLDGNADGNVDSWMFYRDGQIARHEQDTSGDGFRDRVELYRDGRPLRREEDRNGDGRADLTTWFDAAGQPLRRDEDGDGDGLVDMRSHFEGGRLVRRELLSDTALEGFGLPETPELGLAEVSPAPGS